MTTATNIEAATYQATLSEANSNLKEAFKMTSENNISGFKSLVSEILRTNRATNLIAGVMMGGMIAAALLLPGNASADTPARPVVGPAISANRSLERWCGFGVRDLVGAGHPAVAVQSVADHAAIGLENPTPPNPPFGKRGNEGVESRE